MAGNIFGILFIVIFLGLPIGFGLILHLLGGGKKEKREMSRSESRRIYIIAFLAVTCVLLDILSNGLRIGPLFWICLLAAVVILAIRRR